MSITATCSECEKRYTVPESKLNKRVRCKDCGHVFVVQAKRTKSRRRSAEPTRAIPERKSRRKAARTPGDQKRYRGGPVNRTFNSVFEGGGSAIVKSLMAGLAGAFFVGIVAAKSGVAGQSLIGAIVIGTLVGAAIGFGLSLFDGVRERGGGPNRVGLFLMVGAAIVVLFVAVFVFSMMTL